MNTHVALRTLTGLALALAACSSTSGGNGSQAAVYPAFTPNVPQIQRGSLQAISTPILVPVHFPGETLQRELDGALSSWASSGVLSALAEYGVTSGSVAPAIGQPEQTQARLASALPTADQILTGDQIQAWLEGQLDGTHPEFGPVDAKTLASKIFVLFYPSATRIAVGAASSCSSFQSYDAGVTLASGAVAHYVVAPRCAHPDGVSDTDWTIFGATGSILDRIGSPTPSMSSNPSGMSGFDYAHAAFGANGAGLGAACGLGAVNPGASPRAPFSLVTRAWSNASAAAFHDPCVPAPAGAYFVSVPDANDPVSVPAAGVFSRGVALQVGQKKTIDVQLLSDGPTSGPWTVSARLMGVYTGFTFAWDNDVGKDGDTLHLTVTAPSTRSTDIAVIYSTLGDRRSFWLLPVQAEDAVCTTGLLCNGACMTGATDCTGCPGATLLCAARAECVSDCTAGCGAAAPLECFVCDSQDQHPVGTCAANDVASNPCMNGEFRAAYTGGAPGGRCPCAGGNASACPGEDQVCASNDTCFECGDVGLTAFGAPGVCKNGRSCDSATNTCH